MKEENSTSAQNKELRLNIEGDPHTNQKVRNFFGPCSVFRKKSDGSLMFFVKVSERPADSNHWVPIVYVQSTNENIAFEYSELLHWYNLGKIEKVEAPERMSDLVANYKKP